MWQPASKRIKVAGGAPTPTAATGNGIGEVRFETPQSAQRALRTMQNKMLLGSKLTLSMDPKSQDGTKLLVNGLPEGVEWQELKDHFASIGDIAFVDIRGGKRKGPRVAGEVRFETADGAERAVSMLDGSAMGDHGDIISVYADPGSQDGTKVIVSGMPPGTGWQDLKDHFRQVGAEIAFAGLLGAGAGAGGIQVGEVRFDDPSHAPLAVKKLNGSMMLGTQIHVNLDMTSKDSSKVIVSNIPPGVGWQELKDHFKEAGLAIAFVDLGTRGATKGGATAGMGGMGGVGTGEVRYDEPNHAALAVKRLNGSFFMGAQIFVTLDERSKDRSKLIVSGIPPGAQWQELKDHFKVIGNVAHASVGGAKAGGKGGGMFNAGGGGMAGGFAPIVQGGVMWMPMPLPQQQGKGTGGAFNKNFARMMQWMM